MFAAQKRRLARLGLAAAALSVATALAMTGCSSPGATEGGQDAVLTIVASSPPNSLDPVLESVGPIGNMYHYLAYDPLIKIDHDGRLTPGLATEWKYTDEAHTTLELTLRSGVKFADGTAMTAADVVASLDHGRTEGVNGPNWLAAVDSVTAQGDSTVVIKSRQPNDSLPYVLSERMLLGFVIEAKAANAPETLKTATYGAGPYVLDPDQTVANSTYVYVPNQYYWEPSHIHWSRVVITVVADYNAALQAVQSGAADLMSGNQPMATAAKAAGLTVATAPFGLTGIQISDRDGEIVPALKDARVRQALLYAIDRTAIAQAVFGGFSTATPSMLVKGFDGYLEGDDNVYPYDPDKAKQLLADAGYADGFSFDMSVPTANNTNLMAQAIVESWAKLGVKANLQTYTDLGQLTTDILAKKYPVSAFNYGALPSYVQSASFFNGGATQFNPFNTLDDEINQSLLEAAAGTTEQAVNDAYGKAWHRSLVDLAWVSNVYTRDQVTIYDQKKVTDVFISSQDPILDMWSVRPVS
jgi:peptide/nickel transport system substrate-binding protein